MKLASNKFYSMAARFFILVFHHVISKLDFSTDSETGSQRIIFGYEEHYSDALSRSGLVIDCYVRAKKAELCKQLFNEIVDNLLDVLHSLIPFNERPSKNLRNSRTHYVHYVFTIFLNDLEISLNV